MNVYLIRHAKIVTNPGVVQGLSDPIVEDKTTTEAIEKVRQNLGKVDKIYCSKLKRAKQTISLLFPDEQNIHFIELINEYKRPSRFIGRPRSELVNFWEIEHKREKYNPRWKPEDGESFWNCANRAWKFFQILLKDKQRRIRRVAVVGHGTFFRHLVCALVGIEWRDNPKIVIDLLRKFEWPPLGVKRFKI